MNRTVIRTAVASLALFATLARAEVKATVEHIDNDKAKAEFAFKNVPAPSKEGATKYTATIVDGDKDDAGADVDQVYKGKLPTEEDQPTSNFFFASATDGGRILIDLGSAVSISQINTYSWHPNTRGPQVYKMYVAAGTEDKFDAKPKKGTDPEKAGWKKIADVNTKPKEGEGGGQYGVSVADSAGAIGSYRYVLLDVSKTEGDDDNGNTFFSRIDVVTAK